MGHLSTSDRVSSKLNSSTTTNQVVTSENANSSNGSLLANGNATLLKRVNGIASNENKIEQIVKNGIAKNLSADFPAEANGKKLCDQQKQFVPTYHINLEEYERNFKGDEIFGIKFKAPLKPDKLVLIPLLHFIFVICFLLYPLHKLNVPTVLWSFFTGGLAGFGVTAGAHRFWTHRSYKANLPLRIILMACFSLAGQNTLYDWVRDHRVHHKFSETDADPHNSNRGFFFAHVGWLMMLKHPEVLRRGRQIDMSDIMADPVVQFHQKYFIPLKILLCFVLPTLLPIYVWNETWYLAVIQQCVFRYVFSLNFTWSVNSAAHLWGTRPYDKRIMPSENIYVSIIAMGEGWHNYHHVFPWDYKAAELGKYFNFTTMVLNIFNRMGWAWDMKQPSKELVKRTLEKYGDGTHPMANHSNGPLQGHCHYPEVPDPELESDDAESSSTESSKLDENDNLKRKLST